MQDGSALRLPPAVVNLTAAILVEIQIAAGGPLNVTSLRGRTKSVAYASCV